MRPMKLCSMCNVIKSVDDFYFRKTEGRPQHYCKNCFNTYQLNRYIERKKKVIQDKGGKCADCQGVFHYSVYDLHHRDPTSKEFDWPKIRQLSLDKAKVELDKCDLLCSNCHRLRHAILHENKSTT